MNGVVERMVADAWLAAGVWLVLIAVAAVAIMLTVHGTSWVRPAIRLAAQARVAAWKAVRRFARRGPLIAPTHLADGN